MEEVDDSKSTLGYLGPAFQLKVLWQILTNLEFGNEIVPNLHSNYFDVAIQKKLLAQIKKYLDANKKVPQLSNKSINECVNASSYSDTEKEELHGTIKRIHNWDQECHSGVRDNDGDVVQKRIWLFVKQQEYKKFADKIYDKIKTGSLEENVFEFEETIKKISQLGVQHDFGKEIFDDIESALEKDFRNPIPTGIKAIDQAMVGGLGQEEMGIILAPFGAGKTTILTKIANSAFEAEKNVLQIIFEDKVDAVRRKHFAIWSKIPLSQIEERREEALQRITEHQKTNKKGKLIIKKMSQDDVTIPMIKNWIINYEKNFGMKFDMVVLDYIDCVESHKPTNGDDLKAELVVIKAFEAMAAEFKIPCWTAVQGNRSSVSAEFVHADQMGGSIKRAQKTHFLMSIARSLEQKQNNTANLQILKARFAKDGSVFENAIFNNDTLEIRPIEYMNGGKATPFKSNGNLESNLDQKMRDEYAAKALDLAIDDYDKRKPKDEDKPKDEKKSDETSAKSDEKPPEKKLPDDDNIGYKNPDEGDLQTPEL